MWRAFLLPKKLTGRGLISILEIVSDKLIVWSKFIKIDRYLLPTITCRQHILTVFFTILCFIRFPLLHRALVNFLQNLPTVRPKLTTTISSGFCANRLHHILCFPPKPVIPILRSLISKLVTVSVCAYSCKTGKCTHGTTNAHRGQRQNLDL